MQLCSEHRGARAIDRDTFKRRSQHICTASDHYPKIWQHTSGKVLTQLQATSNGHPRLGLPSTSLGSPCA